MGTLAIGLCFGILMVVLAVWSLLRDDAREQRGEPRLQKHHHHGHH